MTRLIPILLAFAFSCAAAPPPVTAPPPVSASPSAPPTLAPKKIEIAVATEEDDEEISYFMRRGAEVQTVTAQLVECLRKSDTLGAAYPLWTAIQLPKGPPKPGQRLVMSPFKAFLSAGGYLVIDTDGGRWRLARQFDLDPTVYVFDGKVWHTGRIVAIGVGDGIVALAKSELRGRYIAIPRGPLLEFIDGYFRSWGQGVKPRPDFTKGGN